VGDQIIQQPVVVGRNAGEENKSREIVVWAQKATSFFKT